MNFARYLVFVLLGLGVIAAAEVPFTVHEWGTFTSVVGSDGRMLTGLELEEEGVPAFVNSFPGAAPRDKGWSWPVRGVTVKMETPVLYFYAAAPLNVRVEVGFNGGSISQWYPDRIDGETPPSPPTRYSPLGEPLDPPSITDFALGYHGRAVWNIDVLAPDATDKITAPHDWETAQWPRARVADANRVRGPHGEVEGFIFYRGIGNFSLPLDITAERDGALTLHNRGTDALSFVWVYEKRPDGRAFVRSWCGSLAASAMQRIAANASATESPADTFQRSLVAAGLTANEASALLATWRESYFDRPGLRVFWIVPRAFTDAVLPLTIEPAPTQLQRVLVGRTEVLTPEFEAQLARDFGRDGGKRWEADRYFRAYRARAQQLGAVTVAPPTVTP